MGNCMSNPTTGVSDQSQKTLKPSAQATKDTTMQRSVNQKSTSPQSDSDTTSPGNPPDSSAGHALPSSRPPLGPSSAASNAAAVKDSSSTARAGVSLTSRQEEDSRGIGRFASYASGASTPEFHSASSDDENSHDGSSSTHSHGAMSGSGHHRASNPKTLSHSTSAIGLDEMIEDRREVGDLRQNVVHIEVPFGKPIEEVYDGVHNGPVLGSGISGLVRLATHKKTGLKYAVKVLDLALVDTTEGLRQLREEIFIMCQLDHPNIVRLEEVYESHSEIYLVQELCLGGELFDRLDEQPDYHYTEAECARLVKQMLSAVRYLHSRGIIHRDLKLENFLFSSTSADSELKMIDFGLSKHFRYGEVQHQPVGTPYTVAPEVIKGTYDERCDIWAIGVISFLLLSGDPPFGGCGGPEPLMTVRSNILRGSYEFEPAYIWANVSGLAREFIRALLVTDPQQRPTARTAQKHAWLQEWASRSRNADTDNVLNPNVVKALVNFKEFSDMRKLLCEVLSFTLLPHQIKDLRREFEKMDTDGSGEISLAALKQVLMTNAGAGSLGALTEEEVEDIFNAMRVRKTETRIHWHEFIAAGLSQCQVDDRNLRLAFDRLDSDHKGYITLDDIMDVMGSDALQSEDAMRQMWGDSMKAVKCQHARITYGDFLLLMKGQSKEAPYELDLGTSVSSIVGSSQLYVVEEGDDIDSHHEESLMKVQALMATDRLTTKLDGTNLQGFPPSMPDEVAPEEQLNNSNHTPIRPLSTSPSAAFSSHSEPNTPAGHKHILDMEEMDSPLSMDDDDDDDINTSGPGVPGSSASLTPPTSPKRGPADYITPLGHRNTVDLDKYALALPGLASKPAPYTRRRSRSVDEHEKQDDLNLEDVADAMRDLLLPETDHVHAKPLDYVVKDTSKSALQVNRKLYRAHRQLRLAVLEASKRFEEQQAEHAREVILAQRVVEDNVDPNTGGMIQAGLVMRRGHAKVVSSEAIGKLLQENQSQQQALVEKASRRGGRGRRSRKKTISDMSGMVTSMGQDEMGLIADAIANDQDPVPGKTTLGTSQTLGAVPNAANGGLPLRATPETISELALSDFASSELESPEDSDDVQVRGATVPGEFRRTIDPFGKQGRYASVTSVAWEA